ncbi:MAG: transcription antitermination factor NusB [Candidatus Poribacteria bacterium]|nr:transcription antitermination factor NusB [Candidatus Poribacteria bacterium]
MTPRTQARVFALQMLYQAEMTSDPVNRVQARFWQTNAASEAVKGFANLLVEGTWEHLATIDPAIHGAAPHWELHRMPVVDRCLLRSGVYELLYLIDIPPAVSINEAIELAKKYSTEDSPQFINAVLDKVKDMGSEMVSLGELRTSGGE